MNTEQNTLPGNAKKTDKQNSNSNKLLEQIKIDETPFTAIRFEDKWFLAIGKYRITEPLKSFEECKEASKDASWWRIMQIINIIIQEHESITKLKDLEKKITEIENQLKLKL